MPPIVGTNRTVVHSKKGSIASKALAELKGIPKTKQAAMTNKPAEGRKREQHEYELANMSLKEYMLQQHMHSDGRQEQSVEQSSPLPA